MPIALLEYNQLKIIFERQQIAKKTSFKIYLRDRPLYRRDIFGITLVKRLFALHVCGQTGATAIGDYSC